MNARGTPEVGISSTQRKGDSVSRFLIILALTGLLAACTTQGGGQTDQPDSTPSTSGSESSGSSRTAAGEPSAACAEAFAPLAEMELSSTSDLGELSEVEATVENCESVADWMAGAQQVVEDEIRPGAADLLLRIRCDAGSLASTPICEELAAS